MKQNTRIKVLKEETINQITLQDLLDLASKAQAAMMQLTDNCMKFNNSQLQKLSAAVMKDVADLADTIRHAIMGSDAQDSTQPKQQIEQPKSSDNMLGDTGGNDIDAQAQGGNEDDMASLGLGESENLGVETKPKIDELVTEAKRILKRLIEATEGEEETTATQETPEVQNGEATDDTNTIDETPEGGKEIDLTSAYNSALQGLDANEFATFKSQVVSGLKASGITDEEFQTLVGEVDATTDVDDFNFAMDKVYDYADAHEIEINTTCDCQDTTEEQPVDETAAPITEAKKKVIKEEFDNITPFDELIETLQKTKTQHVVYYIKQYLEDDSIFTEEQKEVVINTVSELYTKELDAVVNYIKNC